MRYPTSTLIALFALTLSGCSSFNSGQEIEATNRELAEFTSGDLRLNRDSQETSERLIVREALLAASLTQDAAVRVALLGSPALQVLLETETARIADARRNGRLDNPSFTYERLRADDVTDISRILSFGLLELLTLPQRQRIAAAETEAAQLRLAMSVVDEVTRVRQSWVRAVAAQQRFRYAERILESAAASAELAKRMEAAGNFNRISRARQQAFEADARTKFLLAKQEATASREALVRALGLDDADASKLRLPERLPEVPKNALGADVISARVTAERLDLRLAESTWRAAARRNGLGEVTTRTDIDLGIIRDGEAKGYEIEVRLPVFDYGDLDRRVLDGRARAALNNLEETARAAGSHIREAYAGYLAAHEVARNHLDELVPLRRTISDESLLRYNGMIIGVFELLADAREQVTIVIAAIGAEEQFWLADAALKASLMGRPTTMALSAPSAADSNAAKGH